MSRSSFDRNDPAWPSKAADASLEQDDFEDIEADLYIDRDSILESELLETSLEDYDDLLSMSHDDYFDE